MMIFIGLILGFILLIKGADFFVESASNMARLLRISPIVIGLTIVSLGTSAPEATVSLIAALEGRSGVSIGNIVGSNIFNISLVVGVAAFLSPIKVKDQTVKKEIPFMFLASIVLVILMQNLIFQGDPSNGLTRKDGLILLFFLGLFIYYIFRVVIAERRQEDSEDQALRSLMPWKKSLIFILLGLVGLIVGGELVVKNGTTIATRLGMSETFIGLTIIAIGTSLPELATSVTAALKGEGEIALGNVVGSNVMNILFVLGLTATISPLVTEEGVVFDLLIMLFLTGLLYIFSRTEFKIQKIEGFGLAFGYVFYLVYLFLRDVF